jgi:uncharacterized protein YcnI
LIARRRSIALAALLVGAGTAAVIGAGPASAHVTVSSPAAVQGGYATLTFKVPTESATASTVGLKVQLPADQPLASVSILPTQGWSYVVTKSKLAKPISSDDGDITDAVSTIEWKADSAATAIKPGEFNQFVVSAGPLPKAASMTFKAIQTYSDASIVSWIEQAAAGSNVQPDHPAPTLQLAATSGAASSSSPSASNGLGVSALAAPKDSSGKATTGVILGAIGVVLGAVALGALILTRRTAHSRTNTQ